MFFVPRISLLGCFPFAKGLGADEAEAESSRAPQLGARRRTWQADPRPFALDRNGTIWGYVEGGRPPRFPDGRWPSAPGRLEDSEEWSVAEPPSPSRLPALGDGDACETIGGILRAGAEGGEEQGSLQTEMAPAEPAVKMVDTTDRCLWAVKALRAHGGPILIDLEGQNLGRKGSLCILQATALAGGPVFIFDVATLGRAAFEDGGLRHLLEDAGVSKFMYDVRADYDILYHQFGIRLTNVRDMQVLCCAHESRVHGRHVEHLVGLHKAISSLPLSSADRERMAAIKAAGQGVFRSSELGGDAVWLARPLDDALLQYAANDVLALRHVYLQRRDEMPDALLAHISTKRMDYMEHRVQLRAAVRLVGMPLELLNGQTGTVLRQAPNSTCRWAVRLDSDGSELHVHQDQIEELYVCADAMRDFPLPSEFRTIQVGGIGPQACWANLSAHFRQFGAVARIRFGREESGTRSAFVEFEDAASADAALRAACHPPMGPQGARVSVNWPEHVRSFCPQYLDLPPQAPGSAGQLFTGTIKSFSTATGFGFIRSEAAHRIWARDVYVDRAQLGECSVGQQVTFTVELNARCQPQARGLRALRRRYSGSVKFVHPDAGYAFLQCDETFRQLGSDIYAPPDAASGCVAGQEVSFEVAFGPSGQLHAMELEVRSPAPSPDHARQRFMGCVKFLNLEKGFGFIVSNETRAEFGEEIFLHASQATGLSGEKGQRVSFSVILGAKGQPQAAQVVAMAEA